MPYKFKHRVYIPEFLWIFNLMPYFSIYLAPSRTQWNYSLASYRFQIKLGYQLRHEITEGTSCSCACFSKHVAVISFSWRPFIFFLFYLFCFILFFNFTILYWLKWHGHCNRLKHTTILIFTEICFRDVLGVGKLTRFLTAVSFRRA